MTAEIKTNTERLESPRELKIGVVGPMGIGKSTLLLELGKDWEEANFIDEIFKENPYIKNAYKDPKTYAFHSQMWQLEKKARELLAIDPDKVSVFVPLLNDKSYADTYLSGDDKETYENLYDLVNQLVPQPDVILQLIVETDVLHQRIKERNREMEQEVETEFLRELSSNMEINCMDSEIPVIQIDATYHDFRNPKVMKDLREGVEEQIYRKLRDKFNDNKSGLSFPRFIERTNG